MSSDKRKGTKSLTKECLIKMPDKESFNKHGFNEKVLSLTKKIPRGRVTTYKTIAEKLGSKAYRAVGSALRKNPYAPEVPCHRVINSNGFVGQYMGGTNGISKKIKLLRSEGVEVSKDKKVGKGFLWKG